MNIAAIIIGIDGWEQYTRPLVESIKRHEPTCEITVIDNASAEPYPQARAVAQNDLHRDASPYYTLARTNRLCYSAAINEGAIIAGAMSKPDWYIVLSNDVICRGPFAPILAQHNDANVVGPLMKDVFGFPYVEGWCVCIPRRIWEATGGWDEHYAGSDWEDVDFSTTAREHGFGLIEDPNLPFAHLDQRQRYGIVPDFAGKNAQNQAYFMQKHGKVMA